MVADPVTQLLAAASELTLTELEDASHRLNGIWNSKCHLFRIPGELRNRIWRMALIEDIRNQQKTSKEKLAELGRERHGQSGSMYRVRSDERCHKSYFNVWENKKKHDADRFWHPVGYRNQHYELQDTMVSPTFFNACRQMKYEDESILYREIMVWEEWDHTLRRWKTLQPYQMGALFNVRKHGAPLSELWYGSCFCIDKSDFEAPVNQWSLQHTKVRKGIVRVAEELDVKDLVWTIGAPTDAWLYNIIPGSLTDRD